MTNINYAMVNRIKSEFTVFQREKDLTGKPIKWNRLFDSEEEIINTLNGLDLKKLKVCNDKGLYNGYVYITSFAVKVQSGQELTKKELEQSKRLAVEIKKVSSLMDAIEL